MKSKKNEGVLLKRAVTGKPLSAEEREKKICYYRDLFHMSIRSADEYQDNDAYDMIHNSGFDEKDFKFFYERFAALDALDVFYQLCDEYHLLEIFQKQENTAGVKSITDEKTGTVELS